MAHSQSDKLSEHEIKTRECWDAGLVEQDRIGKSQNSRSQTAILRWTRTGYGGYNRSNSWFIDNNPARFQLLSETHPWVFDECNKRRNVYAENKEWFIQFFTTTTDYQLQYSSSRNGSAWSKPTTVYENSSVAAFLTYSVEYENRGGTDYVHLVMGGFTQSQQNIFYKRGTVNTDGTITWSATNVVKGIESGYALSPSSISVTPSGYVFISYVRQTIGTYHQNSLVTFSQQNDGTWSTYTGYPKNVTAQYTVNTAEGQWSDVYAFSDDDIYVIISTMGQVVQGRMIDNHVVQSYHNVTTLVPVSSYFFSGVRYGSSNDIYFSYRDNQADSNLRYCFRNGTSGTWTIQDELVSERVSPPNAHDTYTYPAISFDKFLNKAVFIWLTYEDDSIWMRKKNATGYEALLRITVVPDGYEVNVNPNALLAIRNNYVLFGFSLNRIADGADFVWAYTCIAE